jgi:bifunctional non-homologous end joining protein LigD
VGTGSRPPKWIKPQLTRLVDEAPIGEEWLHEVKYDGYRMHARIDGGRAKLLTRTGLDWSHRYGRTIEALEALPVDNAYIDGELCALDDKGVPVFSRLQAAMDEGRTGDLVFFAFDVLFLDSESTAALPLLERKDALQRLFKRKRKKAAGVLYSDHFLVDGPSFRAQACAMGLEGVISKRIDRPYAPGDRGIWVKSEVPQPRGVRRGRLDRSRGQPRPARRLAPGLLHRRRPTALRRPGWHGLHRQGAAAPLRRAEAAGGGEDAARRAAAARQPIRLAAEVLSKVHWVRPELVVEVTYLTWTEDSPSQATTPASSWRACFS